MDAFEYMLRFAIDPDSAEETVPGLIDFVKRSLIDDVMLFSLGAELSPGHLTRSELEALISMMSDVKEKLLPLGISTSVNQWSTLMHNDQGRDLREGQNFTRMVDPAGRSAKVQACPMDPDFREYLCEMFARYAQIDPYIIWVEDDFRLHNHHPLDWGGCFCDRHMAEYARRAGIVMTRENFVKGVLQEGEPHPYRKIWLDVSRDVMVSLAGEIGNAVRARSDTAQVGLMSSVPSAHSAEGRDWRGILSGLASGGAMINRAHLPAYQERAPGAYLWLFNCISMHTRAMIPPETLVYPELENFPYSRFSKSVAFTRFQIMSALPLDLAGITINIFDFLGNGVTEHEGYGEMLREVKPLLNMIKQSKALENAPAGVRVMFDRNSSYTIHADNSLPSFERLYPRETIWAGLLGAYGVAFAYCEDPDISGEIIAVSGQYFRNLTRLQIMKLLKNNCALIDGEAVETLCDMGCGDLLHIAGYHWEAQDNGVCTYEEEADVMAAGGGIPARASAQTFLGDALMINYSPGAPVDVLMNFIGPEKKITGNGTALVDGRAYIMPYGRYYKHTVPEMPVTLLCPERRDIIQRVLAGWAGEARAPVMAPGLAHTAVYIYPAWDSLAVFVTNASHDPITGGFRLFIGGRATGFVTEVTAKGESRVDYTAEDGVITLNTEFSPLECKLFLLYPHTGRY